MNCTLSKVITFAVGAAIGSAVTWKLLKKKYEQRAQEEIDSVIEAFSRQQQIDDAEEEQLAIDFNTAQYDQILKNEGYANHLNNNVEKEVASMDDRPYVISPDEFGSRDDYETESLTYYADQVLTDEWDNPIEDIDETVGEDSLTHFGEYEDDSVFVRNDALLTDYEILLDTRNFADVKRAKKSTESEE